MARPRTIREDIVLDAARAVFVAKGAEASTREVAQAAGVSQALLFQRYGTKRRLFFAAMLPQPPSLDELLGKPPGADPAAARAHLVELSARIASWIDRAMPGSLRAALHPAFPDAMKDAHAPSGADPIKAALVDRIQVLRDTVGLSSSADSEQTARTLLELLHGQSLTAMLLSDAESHELRAERAVSLIWTGLSGRDSDCQGAK